MFRSPQATTDDREIDAQRAALDVKQSQLRAHKQALASLTNAVNVADRLLLAWNSRVEGASQRISELEQTILTLAAKNFDGVVTSGNEPFAQILTCYNSIATLKALLADADRVRESLNGVLADAQFALKTAQKNSP